MRVTNTKKQKIFLIGFFYLMSTALPAKIAFAQDAPGSLRQMIDPLLNLLSLLLGGVAIVFLVMMGISTFKYVMAQGDPKGMQGAKETLTNNILGLIIAGGVFAILRIVLNVFNLDDSALGNPGGEFESAIDDLIQFINGNF